MTATPSLAANGILDFSEIAPLDVECHYRFQSRRNPQPGSLQGAIVHAPSLLSSACVNVQLRQHPRWDGRSLVNLRIAFVRRRTGIFESNADALYYEPNFSAVQGTLIDGDLLDLTKLQLLYAERLPTIATLFVPEAFEWLVSFIGSVEWAAANEYMCHEAGHRLGWAMADKYANGFFRVGGRLAWPLIYMEEFRADTGSWDIATRTLGTSDAARVVTYTLVHRFAVAAQNLRDGRPGVGYVPYLHFAAMIDSEILRVVQSGGQSLLDFAAYDPTAVLHAAIESAKIVDCEITSVDMRSDGDRTAEAMLEYAIERVRRPGLAESFVRVMRQ